MTVSDTIEPLNSDLLEWIGPGARPYDEVMDAWRTSCPKLPIWEEANARRLLTSQHHAGLGRVVAVSPAGREHLRQHRPSWQRQPA